MADLTGTTPANTYKGLLQVNDYTDGIAGNTGSSALAIQDGAGNATALAVSTDNVGIGTTSPESKLHVFGDITFQGETTDSQGTRSKIIHTTGTSAGGAEIDNDGGLLFQTYDNTVYVDALAVTHDGKVGIGTTSPSAPLEVSSTTGGVIMPRMTTAQRNAIASPTDGEMVYDTDLNKFYGYANGAWTALH